MGGIRHTFISPKVDVADATLVRPSDWNADHVDNPTGGTFGGGTFVSSDGAKLNLATVTDPGLWLAGGAGNQLIAPANSAGLYAVAWAIQANMTPSPGQLLLLINVGAVQILYNRYVQLTTEYVGGSVIAPIAVGGAVWIQRQSGHTVAFTRLSLVRVGSAWAAP